MAQQKSTNYSRKWKYIFINNVHDHKTLKRMKTAFIDVHFIGIINKGNEIISIKWRSLQRNGRR